MISKLIENFKNIKIAVIGDLMLDEYIMGKVDRISPEAPVPVVKVTEEKFVLGGAANVINNLAALGANVYCGGLVGKDKNAEKLINAFPKNVDCNLILKVDNRPTIVKKRVIAGHQQLLRLDWEEEFYINEDEENTIIENFKNIKIAVIGDLMLDEYIMGKVDRISPEAPVPVVKVTEEKFVLGGAANVINNLAALGANVYCGGLVGKDKNAEKLINAFPKNVDCNLILKVDNRPTIVKKRVIAGHQQLLRLDWEEEFYINEDEENIIIKNLKNHIKDLNAVILSDYNKGLLTKSLSQKIINLCRENNVIVTVDPKPKNISNFVGASSITPNKKEAYAAVDANALENIDIVGEKLKKKYNLDTVLITRSEEGMTLYDKEIHNIPTYAKEVYDVTGAGDTVISVFTLAKAAGATWEEAAKIANAAGGIVVGKIGTSTVSEKELVETYNSIYKEKK